MLLEVLTEDLRRNVVLAEISFEALTAFLDFA